MEGVTPLLAGHEWWVATLLIGLGLFLLARFGLPLLRQGRKGPDGRRPTSTSGPATIPPSVRFEPQPLLTEGEAAFYNLIRVAAEEQFLVFAQVPVWCLVDVRADDARLRTMVLSRIAFKRVQFVLVHPGTRRVVKVVEFDDPNDTSLQKVAREHLLDMVFQRAGIPILRLNTQMEYSVAALAGLLGVEPESLDDP